MPTKPWSKKVLVYEPLGGTICQCCYPSLVSSGKNTYAVMFRNAVDGNRDMCLIEWKINGTASAPKKLGEGSWALEACPIDGGGLAREGHRVLTAWRRDRTIFLVAPGGKEEAMGEGKDVTLTVSSKGAYIAWTNAADIELQEPGEKTPVTLSPNGSFPMLVELSDGSVLTAWEQDGAIAMRVDK